MQIPRRVFLGYGVDWATWDRGRGFDPPEGAVATIGGDSTTAEQRAQKLFEHRLDFAWQ
jgi:hypothetical protein